MARDQEPKKKKRLKKGVKIVLIVLIIIGLLGFGTYRYVQLCLEPMDRNSSEQIEFVVEENDTLSTICEKLKDDNLIRDRKVAYYYGRYYGYTDFYAGTFNLSPSMDLKTILTRLNNVSASNVEGIDVTIVEGDWAKDIAGKISDALGTVTSDELISLWNNREWIESQMDTYPFLTEEMFQDGVRCYLEGYLCPDTYKLTENMTAEEITCTILDQTLAVYNEYKDQFEASEYSIHQLYTLASIVQYEGGSDEEVLKNIASVFYNRLEQGMPLESSVTVCYAIDYDKNVDDWQSCEVNTDYDSPYNTYLYEGLPPGPIQNPGVNAIEAVLNPNETDYLYFVADVYNDGTVYFSRTEEEHQALVDKYLSGQG
jgi:UPF0755 protein